MAEKELKKIRVQGVGDDHKVCLWDKSAGQIYGEVLISNDGRVHEVAETAAVRTAIADGRLTTEIDESRIPEEKEEDEEEDEEDEDGNPIFRRGVKPEIKRRGRPPKNKEAAEE